MLGSHAFPLCANVHQKQTVLTKDTKKLNESPTLSVGPLQKPMEIPRTLEYKTQGKSLGSLNRVMVRVNPLPTRA